jgi:hypothetical protein
VKEMVPQALLIHPHPLWSNCRGSSLGGDTVCLITLSGMRRPKKVRNRPFLETQAIYINGRCTMYDYPMTGLN